MSLFLSSIFLKKRHYNRNKKEKIKNKKWGIDFENKRKRSIKKIADSIAWSSLFSDFLLNRNDVVTIEDKEHIKRKNRELYIIAYELLEMSGTSKEDLEDFLTDVDLFEW